MPHGSHQEQRWRRARRESVRRLRRFEDLGHRSQQSREQQVTDALEKRRELRRKQDECMRKPWKRPSTPKKEILKRGDGARRRRAALQRSIEKAADELGGRQEAPGAWHKPTAEASCGVQQFLQQQRARRKGESPPLHSEFTAPHVQSQIPWQDVKIAAEQRFQALLGVDPQQQGLSSGIWSPKPHECGNRNFRDEGLATDNSCYPAHPLESHAAGLTSPSQKCVNLGLSVRQQPVQSQATIASNRSSHEGTSGNAVEGPPPQQLPALSWGAVVGIRGNCATDSAGGGELQLPAASTPLGLTFSDLVRQSMNRAQVVSAEMATRETKGLQERGCSMGAADQVVTTLASPPPLEPSSDDHKCMSTVDKLARSSREQSGHTHERADSPSDQQPSRKESRPTSGAPSGPEIQAQQPQQCRSGSSFTGILGGSWMNDVACARHDTNDGQAPGAAVPSHPPEQPMISRSTAFTSRQDQHAQHPQCDAPNMSSNECGLHAQSNAAEQQDSPAGRMEQLLHGMQHLQILRQQARQELASTFKGVTADAPDDPQSEILRHPPHERSIYEDPHPEMLRHALPERSTCEFPQPAMFGHAPHASTTPGIQDRHPPVRLPELNRSARGKNFQEDEANNTEGRSKDGHPECPKRGRVEAGWGACNRVLVHGLERSCQAATEPGRQLPDSLSGSYMITRQEHAFHGLADDHRLSTSHHSQHAHHVHTSHSGTLEEARNSQPASLPGPTTGASVKRMTRKPVDSCQLTHYSAPTHMSTHMPSPKTPAGVEASMQHDAEEGSIPGSVHDMTLHGWGSAEAAEATQCDAVRSRRRCVRGDSAQSWLSTREHPAPTRRQTSRIPQPPRNPMRPYADLTPLHMAPHSNLPAVRRREQEYADELSLFEREFKELDSDPEVLAMIRKKSYVPKTVAPSPHDYSMGSVSGGCAPLRSSLCATDNRKIVHGKGNILVHDMHSYCSKGTLHGQPVAGPALKQGAYEKVSKWQATEVRVLSESMEMRQLEESLQRLNGRLQSGRQVWKRSSAVGQARPCRPPIPRTSGYARKTRGKHASRSSPHREGRVFKRPDKARPLSPKEYAAPIREGCVERWEGPVHSVDGYVKQQGSSEARLIRVKGSMQNQHSRADMNMPQWEPAPGLPTPQEAHTLWRHIITAGMMATFGSGAGGSLGGWDAMALPRRKTPVASKLGS